ncbi:PEP-CTERM sorting domain-containing protein [Sphingomonadaceae bacterium jetA1]|jgi:hypothetical protein|uniref:Npun_F0296 family exosortase-dependent surface protein n=1 Tax=Facivitalis istanbulensis TaxID=3075838 RepID=UPI0034953DFF
MPTRHKLLLAACAMASTLIAAPALAGVTSVAYDQPAPAGATVVDFNRSGSAGLTQLPNGFSLTGNYRLVTGTVTGAAAPAGDKTQYLAVSTNPGARLTADKGYTGVGVYWGSADTFNRLSILDTAGNLIKMISGGEIGGTGADNSSGDWYNAKYNRYVTFTLDGDTGQKIGALQFDSDRTAFELDNVSFFNSTPTSVPEPATVALFGLGILGLVVLMKRNKLGTSKI